jgi:hypothetical protein
MPCWVRFAFFVCERIGRWPSWRNSAFYEIVPFSKSDTIVMLGSSKAKSGTGISKSARIVINCDEVLVLVFILGRI